MNDFKPRAPDYSGNGIAIWKDEQDGEVVLKVSVLGGKPIWCKKVQAKPKPADQI